LRWRSLGIIKRPAVVQGPLSKGLNVPIQVLGSRSTLDHSHYQTSIRQVNQYVDMVCDMEGPLAQAVPTDKGLVDREWPGELDVKLGQTTPYVVQVTSRCPDSDCQAPQ
jgi:hypothetical protein